MRHVDVRDHRTGRAVRYYVNVDVGLALKTADDEGDAGKRCTGDATVEWTLTPVELVPPRPDLDPRPDGITNLVTVTRLYDLDQVGCILRHTFQGLALGRWHASVVALDSNWETECEVELGSDEGLTLVNFRLNAAGCALGLNFPQATVMRLIPNSIV
jgi:hypothetical protein